MPRLKGLSGWAKLGQHHPSSPLQTLCGNTDYSTEGLLAVSSVLVPSSRSHGPWSLLRGIWIGVSKDKSKKIKHKQTHNRHKQTKMQIENKTNKSNYNNSDTNNKKNRQTDRQTHTQKERKKKPQL